MDFLASLIIIFLALWCVGWVLRALFRGWLSRRVAEFNRAAGQAQREARRQARGDKEGDVTVEGGGAASSKSVRCDVGEYVEFEETIAEETGREGAG